MWESQTQMVALSFRTHPGPRWGAGISQQAGNLRTASSSGSGGGSSFLSGLGHRGSLAAALGLRRRSRRFSDELSAHHAGDKQLGAMIVKVNGGTFLIGRGDHTQSVHFMLDRLAFLHCLHNVLLDSTHSTQKKLFGRRPGLDWMPAILRLEAGNVLSL